LSELNGPEVIDGPGAGLVTISGNNSTEVFFVDSYVTATLSGLTIADGFTDIAHGGAPAGGGIFNASYATLTINGCAILNNTTGHWGGGIYNKNGWVTLENSTVAGNAADVEYGGGGANAGTLAVLDSTIADNFSLTTGRYDQGGGGIWDSGTLTAVNTTIAYNHAATISRGGGFYVGDYRDLVGPVTLYNTIVALNTDSNGADDLASSANQPDLSAPPLKLSPASSYNLVGIDETGSLTNGVNGNQVGVTNPGLGPLASNGGPTQTIALLPGSPAIDAGSNSLIPPGVTPDQRGFARIVNGTVDIGAFEAQQETTATTVTAAPSTSVFGQSVTFTTTVAPQAGSPIPTATGSIQFEIDGSNVGSPVPLVNGSATSAAVSSLSVASHTVSAVYTSNSTDFLASMGSTSLTVEAATVSNIQSVVNNALSSSGGSVTLLTTSDAAVSTAVQAVNAATPSGPVTVTLDLGGGTYTTDNQVNTQPDVTLVIQNGTLVGGSPALVVASGNVILSHVTALNGTNAPTIVVNGGKLVIRNSTIQESTGYAQAAILITGGSVDLGTASSPGGNIVNVNGAGSLIQNTSGNPVPAVGDTFENNGVAAPSIFVLNPTANGALTLSGNASIQMPGVVIVESSSKTALSAGGNTQLSAWATGVSVLDPLAGLTPPCPTGLTNYGSINLTGGSQTICPGLYSQIHVSGNASLTLSAGTYIIEGGGFTVTGKASVTGSGVTIYNAGSNYPSSGGTFGGISLSGNGTFNLTAPTSGTYAGILIFQSRQNTRALSFSGDAMAGMSGTIYAANALLSMSGNASLQNPVVVGMLNLSGNVSLTQIASGSDGTGDVSGIANTLLAGNLSVFLNDPNNLFTADQLARIQDAINAWNAILAPYNVTITEVSDPTLANLVLDTSTTSACGGAANGVLGCYNEPNNEITMIQGWNWYAGADPSQIGAGQYDFETTVLHELGHALGLGGSTNPSSPMYETLAAGVADRTPATQDLNIPDPPEGADPRMAAGFHPFAPSLVNRAAPASNGPATCFIPLDTNAALDAGLAHWTHSRAAAKTPARASTVAGPADRGRILPVSGGPRTPVLQAASVDSVLGEMGALPTLFNPDGENAPGRIARAVIPSPGTKPDRISGAPRNFFVFPDV
jgi:hypothetical protein